MTSLAPGTRLGPYEIVSSLGAGGMGQVYKARDTRLDRTVALKTSQERFSERFEREARAIAALNHPHICTLFDVGPDYLVMEYLEGHALKGPLPLKTALQYAVQAADALHAAHVKGVIHRDFKPSNILVTKSGVKLLDFGLAKIPVQSAVGDATATIAEPLTQENSILGTLQYMSPEQLEGKAADARSDIFSFGLVLYETIAGKPAFQGKSQASLIAAILKEEPPSLSGIQPLTPAALDRVARKCLAKDPDARWQTASDLRDELQWIGETAAAPATAPIAVAPTRGSAGKWLPAALALAVGLAAGIFWQSSRTPAPVAWAATRLGGPVTAYCPRISPDGQMIAFLTAVNHLTQVAVMKADGSSWTLLTTARDAGYVSDLSWALDGSRIYFSRFFDQPRGVYSVPALGGESRLLLDNAFGCTPLPDGSLIVAGLAGQADFQLRRFWPESGRNEPLPVFIDHLVDRPSVEAFPDGKEIVLFGVFSATPNHSGAAGILALDLERKTSRPLGTTLPPWRGAYRPLAVTPDGQWAITLAQVEDVIDVVRIPRDGGARIDTLFSLPATDSVNFISQSGDGSVYLDMWDRPKSVLRFSAAGGDAEETPQSIAVLASLASLPGEKYILPAPTAGKQHLVIGQTGVPGQPFLQTSEESGAPFAVSAGGRLAFGLGIRPRQEIAIASLREGRILRRLSIRADEVRSVALSPDEQTLYYAAAGTIWSLPVNESSPPHRIMEGDDAAIDPSGRFLYVKQTARDPAILVRVPVTGGNPEPISMPGNLRLTTDPISPNAVDAQGRVLLETSSPDSFFFSTALFDPVRKTVTPVPVRFEGDIWSPVWSSDGHILAIGARFSSSIWRYHPVKKR